MKERGDGEVEGGMQQLVNTEIRKVTEVTRVWSLLSEATSGSDTEKALLYH